MFIFTKASLIQKLLDIKKMGWVPNTRAGNDGAVGNVLEDLLGIEENNLALANAGEWELKAQRSTTSSLLTLCHLDPSPRAASLVTRLLLPEYGWPHAQAGHRYPPSELSFRQTINATRRTDRGFGIVIDRSTMRVVISFDSLSVGSRHGDWLRTVEERVGLGELEPQPYWGFNDLVHKMGTKLHNAFLVVAETRRAGGKEYFHYSTIYMLRDLHVDGLVDAIAEGHILIDFDARTGHNHGTKFRIYQKQLPRIYRTVEMIDQG